MKTIRKIRLSPYFISIISVFAVAFIGYLFANIIGYRVVAFLLLVTVSVLAMLYGIFPVLLASILSALVWDFFFIPPKFTFSVGTTEDEILLLMYLIIASINAVLTNKIRRIEKQHQIKGEKENEIKLYNTLFNSLSHELQTPITTIIGATDALNDDLANLSKENKKDLINEISIASLRLNEQVENLLNISRLESGYLQIKTNWCDVNELIYSVINKFQHKLSNHKINVIIPENFPLFKIDYGIMEQVLHNLIQNAIQYTPENTIIKISLNKSSEQTNDKHHLTKLIITVSDNGKGFPENETTNIFNKFYRLQNSKPGGTGLGLSIVKGFVEAHKGKIELKNIPEKEAKFIISIPAEESYINMLKNE